MKLEYPMQLGSRTTSISPGFTYLGQKLPWGWGAEFIPTVRLGRNSNGYRLGNRYTPSVWGARQLTRWLTLSARANGEWVQNITSVDRTLDRNDEPTKDPSLQAGKRLDLLAGLTLQPTGGILQGQQFYFELDAPLVQSLNGPQLQKRWVTRFSWQIPLGNKSR